MTLGFFPPSVISSRQSASIIPACGQCGLYKHCRTPKMPYTGSGRKRILVVAEAPGKQEDIKGIQLIGKSGQHFRNILKKRDIDLDKDCWKTNAVCCRPEENVTPTDKQIESCRPNVLKVIEETKPEIILLLGISAVKSIIGPCWGSDIGPISRWVGWTIPSIRYNARLCPNYHPAYLLRQKDAVIELWFCNYLDSALAFVKGSHSSYSGNPEYSKQIKRVYDELEVSKFVEKILQKGGRISFDFETDRLKPDSTDSRITSCAICWEGKRTIAFPWKGQAVSSVEHLLLSEIGKIGCNIKFEERWCRKLWGHGVNNWVWDTMLAAHIIDNRSDITSLKFQSFVLLGQDKYNEEIELYLKASGGNEQNRIREADLGQLLLYNGMDALLTFKVAEKQMDMMV